MAFGFGFGLPMIGNPQWSPASLFYQSEPGAWYDPSDLSTLYQDQAGTTPVTAVEQSVGLMKDKSGRGNHAYTPSASATSRPVLSARYNLLTKTEQFNDAAWTKTAATATANTTTAPDGTLTAETFTDDATNDVHYIGRSLTTDASTNYTYSVYLKNVDIRYISLSFNRIGASTVWASAVFDLVGGAVTGTNATAGAALVSSAITAVGNGWYRCQIVANIGVSTDAQVVIGGASASSGAAFRGMQVYTGTLKSAYIWGADLRVSNEPSTLPVYQRVNTSTDYDTVGFPLYLKADGVDDYMQTNSIDFTATDKMTVWAGVRKLSDAATGIFTELSADLNANNGAFYVLAPNNPTSYALVSKGTLAPFVSPTGYAAPITNVLTGIGNISGDVITLRINGTQAATSAGDQGTGTYGNYPLYLFRRGGSSLPFNGRFYGMTVLGAAATTNQIVQGETYLNQKMGLVY